MPKILIFGQSFNNNYGGGITISNLFKDYEKKNIRAAVSGSMLSKYGFDNSYSHYQLGEKEYKWRFPLSLFQKSFPSGKISSTNTIGKSDLKYKASFRSKFVNKLVIPFFKNYRS